MGSSETQAPTITNVAVNVGNRPGFQTPSREAHHIKLPAFPELINNYAAASTTVSAKEARFADKVKAGIAKLGTGPEARVEVSLRDKTKLKGYVSEASEGSFVVVNDKTGAATEVLYPQVKKAKGHNLETGEIIGLGLFFGIIVTLIILYARK